MTIDARSLAVIAVALVGCACDLRTRRVPNVVTFGAAAAAVGFSLLQHGWAGVAWSGAGWFVAVLLFVPFFALGGLGAGDVKLLGALGAWLGGPNALYLAFYTSLAGGIMALIVVVMRRHLKTALRNLWLLLCYWRTVGVRPLPELTLETARGPKLAYAVPIAMGALATLWLR